MKTPILVQFIGPLFLLISNFCYSQNVGIGTLTPGSGLELKGTGVRAQLRITDATSGNTLVLQGGTGANMKITGYNYGTGTAQPLYLSVDGANTILNPSGGKVGIGTSNPATKLTVQSNLFGIEQTNGTVRVSTYLSANAGWFGTITNHSLHFYTNNSLPQVTLTTAGQLGIGTSTPTGGYLLDVAGPIKSIGNTTHFVAQTNGGTNSWARFYMRSASQSWFAGTSQNFNGNQLYIADETFGQTRFSIQPNGGPIYMTGNLQQNVGSYGLPKALLYVNGDAAIIRCYNALNNSTSGGCGFSTTKNGSGDYRINVGFDLSTRFYSVSLQNNGLGRPVTISYEPAGSNAIDVHVYLSDEGDGATFENTVGTDRPFMLVVY